MECMELPDVTLIPNVEHSSFVRVVLILVKPSTFRFLTLLASFTSSNVCSMNSHPVNATNC